MLSMTDPMWWRFVGTSLFFAFFMGGFVVPAFVLEWSGVNLKGVSISLGLAYMLTVGLAGIIAWASVTHFGGFLSDASIRRILKGEIWRKQPRLIKTP